MPADIAALIALGETREPLRPPLVVYGAGGKGRRTLRFLASQGLRTNAVLDSHAKPGQTCEGLPVLSPAQWAASRAAADHTAVVAIHNPGTNLAQLGRQVSALGFVRVVLPVELHQIFGAALAADYFLAPAEFYVPHAAAIARTRALYADEASRLWFDRALEFRLGGDYSVLPAPSPADQYRPVGLARWKEPMRLADCGAYDGDSLRHLATGGYRVEALAAFEADAANFRRLSAEPALPVERYLVPCAVGARSEMLRFASGEGAASHLDAAGDTWMACVSLDESIPQFHPTLIKMDIEGAEYDALCGGARIVAQDRPGLAISAYHRPEHLWQLAQLVDSWRLGYRLYLRGHAHSTFDLVLYALSD